MVMLMVLMTSGFASVRLHLHVWLTTTRGLHMPGASSASAGCSFWRAASHLTRAAARAHLRTLYTLLLRPLINQASKQADPRCMT